MLDITHFEMHVRLHILPENIAEALVEVLNDLHRQRRLDGGLLNEFVNGVEKGNSNTSYVNQY